MKTRFLIGLLLPLCASAQPGNLQQKIDMTIKEVLPKCIEWRRDFHQHPELGNREWRTAGLVVAHLKKLGIEVTDSVAHTGVVGVLKGGKPGPVIALRADMDALPVTERADLPFASRVKAVYDGREVGVMHACGHDAHTAILMSVAEVLAKYKSELKGTVKFLFQPAEEGVPRGETGGAKQMIAEGVLRNPDAEVIFGLHIDSQIETGTITYRPAGTMASACDFKITVKGKGSHGSQPWSGTDPIVVSSYIITQLQTLVSRNINIRENPAVVTVGSLHSGVRFNIIPEDAVMLGTIRALTGDDEKLLYSRVKEMAENTAAGMGATAAVEIPYTNYYPVTYNDPALLQRMLPRLQNAAGAGKVQLMPPKTGSEDFSYFAKEVPGLFFFLGAMPPGKKPGEAAAHHTPDFFIDENSFQLGIKAFCNLVLGYAETK